MRLKGRLATVVAITLVLLHVSTFVEAAPRGVFESGAPQPPSRADRRAVDSRLIVGLRQGNSFPAGSPAKGERWFQKRWGVTVRDWRHVGDESYVLDVSQGTDVLGLARKLATEPEVEYAEPDYIYRMSLTPNDEFYSRLYALPRIAAPQAWDRTTGTPSILIAVVDTGVYAGHPDFGSNIVAGPDFVNDDGDASDDQGHGTHTAGIIAAIGNNGRGVAGVCWQCKVLPVKALDEQGAGSASDVARAIRYASDRGAKVINLSLGGENDSQTLHNAIIYAAERGVLIVVAGGNEAEEGNPIEYPAAYEEVLAVGATDHNDLRASFSNYGSYIDAAAPGVDIGSTLWVLGSPEQYGAATGTSEAAPFVAGLAGLVWAVNPSLSRDEVRDVILSTVDDLGAPGRDPYFGAGRINAHRAVTAAAAQIAPPPAPPPPPSTEAITFPETGYSLRGEFRRFWEANGDLRVFGFPISEERVEETSEGAFLVQYFERNRFELHPENAAPYNVLLGRLGDTILQRRSINWNSLPKSQPQSGCVYFAETGHSICEPFLSYWRSHGLRDQRLDDFGRSLALFGMPLTEPAVETNSSGDTVLTQWFERARFEDHGDAADSAGVLLGLLGNELGQPTAVPVAPPGDESKPPAPPPAPVTASPCPPTPPSQDGRSGPDACLALGTEMEIDVFGFRAGEQVSFWLTSPMDQVFGAERTITVGSDGSLAGLRYPTAGLSPGRWFWVFEGRQSGHQSIVFYHLYKP